MEKQYTPQQQRMLDRHKNPHHQGSLVDYDAQAQAVNPLCGDRLTIQLKLQGNRVEQIAWQGQGCIISQAGADLSIDSLIGQPLAKLQAMTEDDYINLIPLEIRPSRRKCALLLQQCLQEV